LHGLALAAQLRPHDDWRVGYNLAVFAWRKDLDSAARRKKAGVTSDDVYESICESGAHVALGSVDFGPFERAVAEKVGRGDNAPYTVERYERARVFRLAYKDVPHLVTTIGLLARKFGLTSAGERGAP
jgi:hypothetical protein